LGIQKTEVIMSLVFTYYAILEVNCSLQMEKFLVAPGKQKGA
jgi:hypothetical protein